MPDTSNSKRSFKRVNHGVDTLKVKLQASREVVYLENSRCSIPLDELEVIELMGKLKIALKSMQQERRKD
jgi:hypothetical protein